VDAHGNQHVGSQEGAERISSWWVPEADDHT